MAKVKGFEELRRNLELFKREAKDVIVDAVYHGCTLIANEARDNHPYTDRTENLTQSIQEQKPELEGSKILCEVHAGGKKLEVIAGMDYSIYVELGTPKTRPYPFLFPALEKMSNPINRGIGALLIRIRWIE